MRFRSSLYVFILATVAFVVSASAQNGPPQEDGRPPDGGPRQDQRRPNLLRELGLSPDQLQQLKQINQERRPQAEAAMHRLSDANRALDEAIYADVVNDADVATRLKEVEAAQAAVARVRFMNELAVRKILTPDQLVRFRDLRRQFAEAREKFRSERQMPSREKPFRRASPQPKAVQE